MPVKRFVTKRVEIDAMQFDGENFEELFDWTNAKFMEERTSDGEFQAQVYDVLHATWISVKTGQWIVRGAKGEFYPCDDETFHWKYEEVESFKADPFMVAQIDYKFFKEDWRDSIDPSDTLMGSHLAKKYEED